MRRNVGLGAALPRRGVLIALGVLPLVGCGASLPNESGRAPIDLATGQRGPLGVGIEGQDLTAMTDQMVREMLETPALANSPHQPQVIVDAQYFQNLSSQRINLNLITDRLRFALSRAARGRLVFVSRESFGMVHQERSLRRGGVVDRGTAGMAGAQASADYRLIGRLNSLDQRVPRTGEVRRMTQITFEMVNMERGTIIWQGLFELERSAADDVVYR